MAVFNTPFFSARLISSRKIHEWEGLPRELNIDTIDPGGVGQAFVVG